MAEGFARFVEARERASLRTRFVVTAAVLTGITGFAAAPASAAPAARHAGASQPPAAAALTGATQLTLSNGTRVVVDAPWAGTAGHTEMAGPVRSFMAAQPGGFFCFYGAAQSGFATAPAQANVPKYTLTIKGFDLTGAPANLDGTLQVFSATSMTWNENTIGPTPVFRHGLVTMHVPAGKY